MICSICERRCDIPEHGTGGCGMYLNDGQAIRECYPDRYLAAIDAAIESMPLMHFHPRGRFLQVCTVGCNFSCPGCVSTTLTDHRSALDASFQDMTPGEVIRKARDTSSLGIMFCFNEPTVSFQTFLRLARMARDNGLLVGCSTNAYMTSEALDELLPWLDFVNVGLKGATAKSYRCCGVPDPAPVWRNLAALFHGGVHVEVSIMYRQDNADELFEAASRVAAISPEIPFQVMRFMPFDDSTRDLEPTVLHTESVCRDLRRIVRHVYLFNTPGTESLHSRCPECGAVIVERGFFGPMCANVHAVRPDARCSCGYGLPIRGRVHAASVGHSGYFGGYRTISSLNMVRAILEMLGVTDRSRMDHIMQQVLRTDFIKTLYQRLNSIPSYFDTVDHFARLAGCTERARAFRDYVSVRLSAVTDAATEGPGPRVYCCLGHPLIAMFEDKMEARLIRLAGGRLTNADVQRGDQPGITIRPEDFNAMRPDIIIVTGLATAWPKDDILTYCADHGLDAPALRTGRIHHLYPYRASTNPDWILGLVYLANIIQPDKFHFDVEQAAVRFHQEFFADTPGKSLPHGHRPGQQGHRPRPQTSGKNFNIHRAFTNAETQGRGKIREAPSA